MAFNEIIGYWKEKESLEEIITILNNMDMYERKGVHIPRGVLLVGEPGVGKTLMAKSIAEEGFNSVELRAADCVDVCTLSSIIDAFEKARQIPNTVLVIDELDKICETNQYYYSESNEGVMKILLQELDKKEDNENMMIVATANSIDKLNSALIRPGRFDRIINIGLPNKEDRKAIINYYLDKIRVDKKLNVDYLVQLTAGLSCADIECLINECGIFALNNECEIDNDVVSIVLEKMKCMDVKYDIDTKNIHTIAVHEAGHALVAYFLCKNKSIINASVVKRGEEKGRVSLINDENNIMSLSEYRNLITVALAGIQAEKTTLGEAYNSSSQDLENAYGIAQDLVIHHGYFGPQYEVVHDFHNSFISTSDVKITYIEKRINELLKESMELANELISSNYMFFTKIVTELEKKYVLNNDDLERMFKEISEKFKENVN